MSDTRSDTDYHAAVCEWVRLLEEEKSLLDGIARHQERLTEIRTRITSCVGLLKTCVDAENRHKAFSVTGFGVPSVVIVNRDGTGATTISLLEMEEGRGS